MESGRNWWRLVETVVKTGGDCDGDCFGDCGRNWWRL